MLVLIMKKMINHLFILLGAVVLISCGISISKDDEDHDNPIRSDLSPRDSGMGEFFDPTKEENQYLSREETQQLQMACDLLDERGTRGDFFSLNMQGRYRATLCSGREVTYQGSKRLVWRDTSNMLDYDFFIGDDPPEGVVNFPYFSHFALSSSTSELSRFCQNLRDGFPAPTPGGPIGTVRVSRFTAPLEGSRLVLGALYFLPLRECNINQSDGAVCFQIIYGNADSATSQYRTQKKLQFGLVSRPQNRKGLEVYRSQQFLRCDDHIPGLSFPANSLTFQLTRP